MKNRKILVAASACAAAIIIIAVVLLLVIDRGVKAVDTTSYLETTAELEAGSELKALPDSSQGVPGMKLVADNAELSLYFNPETTEVAVKDKRQNRVWYTNPEKRNEDTIASPYEKEVMSSQVSVLFRDSVGTLNTFTNFGKSISSKQFTVESIASGVRITYTLGDMSLGIDALPKYISKARMEEKLVSKLDASQARYVSTRYYPKEGSPDILERLDEQVSKQLVLNKMIAAFQAAGYTEEDLAFDNAENGVTGSGGSDKPTFTIPIEYRLDGGELLVSVPVSHIKESGAFKIGSIELLNFFGAADSNTEGYIFVPDGSGSLINLNNGKVKEEQYVQKVYGFDPNDNSWRRGQVTESARMPVFGMKAGDAAWFAVIEKGDAIASIAADVSGRKNGYNYAYTSFALRGEDELELYTGATIQEIELLNEQIYTGDIQVRYSFLPSEQASYSGMAEHYREKLVKEQSLQPLSGEKALPFYLTITGSVDKRKSMLGVPYDSVVSMTSFKEASQIAMQLKQDGVDRLMMRYSGWFGKGVNHKTPVKLKTDDVLGSKQDLAALAKQLEDAGGMLFPDVAFQQMYHDDGGFAPSSDAARFVTREEAELYPYNRALNRMDMFLGTYYLLSPAKLPYYVDKFMNQYDKLGMNGLSLRDLGGMLVSDYRVSRVVQRETAKEIVKEQLGKLDERIRETMVAGGNSYAFPYADHLIDVPTDSSGFLITDEEVPFYEMVVHGSVDYAGKAINLSDEQDTKLQLLKAIELGAAPYFSWTYEPSSKLKFTHFDTSFSTSYKDWYDQAVAMYKEANAVLAPLRSETMMEHIRHQEGVVEVKYSNGSSIIVNYTDQAATVGGVTVAPQHYSIGGEQP
ncbi:DUF5696 domain-containing protein [Paenibacillus harenae]|uniref:DUF5696 domain-containing protein n=1 Tax=Paenibacillus harenae TaxID=306543 RepID=UPI002792C2B2|nr:DUF5696 domain-containing protein [Paenibacillus harenae]MDQ0058571.1 hypothetical protein [Paenibacillus harenae]